MSGIRHFPFAPPIDSGALFLNQSLSHAAQVPDRNLQPSRLLSHSKPLQVRLWSYCALFFDHFGEHNSHDERDKDHSPHLKRMALSVLLCRYEYASAT
ncbi:hypothetical protein [Rhizobium mongolense]|uniref:hypothetical protein n=1 Tax=Rhizobium mongolense TaxID=57676 RepID=UPI0034A17477